MNEVATRVQRHGGLAGHGYGTPRTYGRWRAANPDLHRIDAELLAARVLGTHRARIVGFPETRLTRQQADALNKLAHRLREREPLAYILGQKEFFGLNFRVGEGVLVPRPETELLVELALRLAPRKARILDLGTGSGCIAVSLKRERPDLRVIATDISHEALVLASANAAAQGSAVTFVQGDWLGALRGRFDCIVANPPYVAEGDPALATLCREPRLALAAGADGLAAIDRIARQAPSRLAHSGCLLLEHGCNQAAKVRARLARRGFGNIETHRDLAGLERATVGFAED